LSDQMEMTAGGQPEQLLDNWGILCFSVIFGRYISLTCILPQILYHKYIPQIHF